jgi:F-type H+-transporting ATPase subunit b
MKVRTVVLMVAGFILSLGVGAALASGGGEGPSPWNSWTIGWRIINTIALLVLLGYFLKGPLSTFFKERTSQIERDLAEAREEREKAERTIKEYEAKMAGMEEELEKMRAALAKSAATESETVVANAERMAKGIVESARIAAEQEVRKAKTALRNEAVALAVKTAEAIVSEKITADDHKRIVEDYLAKVEGMK